MLKSISQIHSKADKAFYLERLNLYTRIIAVLADKYNWDNSDTSLSQATIDELKNIGVIDDEQEISKLRAVTTSAALDSFVAAVNTYLAHPNEIMPHMGKLHKGYRNAAKSEIDTTAPAMVDFFCGAGGMSLGFVKAGYRVVLANDIVDECVATYELNHPELSSDNIVQNDIRNICENINDFVKEPIDIVVGGPPCQGFSSANRQRIIEDPRNELYKYFLKAVERIAPKIVVMENVKGMLTVADQVVEDFGSIKALANGVPCNYSVAYRLINSADYGVPQNRIRLIYIAIRSDVSVEKGITPDTIFGKLENETKLCKNYILKDALDHIRPLESPRIKGLTETDDELTGKKVDINPYADEDSPYLNVINDNCKLPITFNHKARYASDVNFKIFSLLNQGEDASNEKIKGIMPYEHRLHCFKDKYFRLYEDRPCRTITAHLKMDCLSHIHPTQTRTITPREAARVQSFPDDYIFLGAYLKTFMQIGNAVPVLLAKHIANVIKPYI